MNLIKIYMLELRSECLQLLRMPGKLAPLVLFPAVFYSFFGLSFRPANSGASMASYLLGTYSVFGIMGAALMGIGAGLAVERDLGWLQLKRASPMPAAAHLAAKMTAAVLLGLMIVLMLLGLGFAFGGVRMPWSTGLALAGTLALGSVPFCALGLAIGYFAGAQSVHAIVNLFYLPMAFCSGLWIPVNFLPKFLQSAAPALPPYHLAQAALAILQQPSTGTLTGHAAALTGFTVVFLGLAWLGHSLDESRG